MTILTVYAPGHYDVADSYGLIACQLARELTRLGVYVNAMSMGKTVMDSQPPDVLAVTTQPIRAAFGGIFLGYPDGYHKHTNPLAHIGSRVAITMFESSKIPASWIDPLNDMDAVIVPSRFCAQTFAECGVTVPIHVVPLGVGEVYRFAERPKDRPLTFLTFGDRGARKGGQVAEQAFLKAFGDDTNYQFIIKTRKPKQAFQYTNPNMRTVQRDMTEEELYQLYLECDVLINPHRGEGFGLIPREFAATGGIALTTDWSGTADDLDQWGWPLPYMLERADWTGNKTLRGTPELVAQDLGEWAACDRDNIAKQLLQVAANIDYYRRVASQKAFIVPRLYSWRAFAEQILSIWEGVQIGYSNRLAAA